MIFLLDFGTIPKVWYLFFLCKCIRLQYISVLCAIGLNSYFTAILGLFHMQFHSLKNYTLLLRFFYWILELFRECGLFFVFFYILSVKLFCLLRKYFYSLAPIFVVSTKCIWNLWFQTL